MRNIPTLASVGVPNAERDSRIKSKVTEKQVNFISFRFHRTTTNPDAVRLR